MNLENSFLNRVPALMNDGLSMEDAIVKAMTDEETLLIELHQGRTERAKDVTHILKVRTYHEARRRGETNRENQTIDEFLIAKEFQDGVRLLDAGLGVYK